jgi:hypothetical protein
MHDESGTGKKENNSLYQLAAVLIGFIAALKGIPNEPRTERNDDNAKEDALIRNTKRLGWATVVIAVVGVLSFAAALLQWSALRDANRTTEESFSAVQRPFITFPGLNISQQAYGGSSPQYWHYQILIENSGNTPTKNMTVISAVSFSVPIVPATGPDPTYLTPSGGTDYLRPLSTDSFIGPHGKVNIDAVFLFSKTLQEMAQTRSDFFIDGIARYRDQFSNTPERVTKFCFVVQPAMINGTVEVGNYGTCLHWNCGDEDCERDEQNYESDLRAVLRQNPKATEIKRQIPTATILPFYPIPKKETR